MLWLMNLDFAGSSGAVAPPTTSSDSPGLGSGGVGRPSRSIPWSDNPRVIPRFPEKPKEAKKELKRAESEAQRIDSYISHLQSRETRIKKMLTIAKEAESAARQMDRLKKVQILIKEQRELLDEEEAIIVILAALV